MDKDGYISNGELFQVLKMMVGNNLKDTQLQQIVDKTIINADKDGDGRISFEEFCAVSGSPLSPRPPHPPSVGDLPLPFSSLVFQAGDVPCLLMPSAFCTEDAEKSGISFFFGVRLDSNRVSVIRAAVAT